MDEELELDLSLDEPGGGFTPDEAAASLAFATTLGEGMMPQEMPADPEDPQEAPDEQAVMAEQSTPPGRRGAGDLDDGNMATQGDIEAIRAEIEAIKAELEGDGPLEEPTKPEGDDGQTEESTTTSEA